MNRYELEQLGILRHEELIRQGNEGRLARKVLPARKRRIINMVTKLLTIFLLTHRIEELEGKD